MKRALTFLIAATAPLYADWVVTIEGSMVELPSIAALELIERFADETKAVEAETELK